MIVLLVSDKQIKEAESRYSFGSLNGSITNGESNIYGALGEIVVRDYYLNINNRLVKVIDKPTYDYDLIINSKTTDIKTKQTTVTPRPFYNVSISNFNTKQNCDYYYFVRILKDKGTAYLLGYIEKDKFIENAEFKKKGEKDGCNWEFKDDCYNLPISKLRQIS